MQYHYTLTGTWVDNSIRSLVPGLTTSHEGVSFSGGNSGSLALIANSLPPNTSITGWQKIAANSNANLSTWVGWFNDDGHAKLNVIQLRNNVQTGEIEYYRDAIYKLNTSVTSSDVNALNFGNTFERVTPPSGYHLAQDAPYNFSNISLTARIFKIKLNSDTGSSSSDGVTNDGRINVGSIMQGNTWQYSLDAGTTWLQSSGSSIVLSEGSYAASTIKVHQTDGLGRTGSDVTNNIAFRVDTTTPTMTLASGQEMPVEINQGVVVDLPSLQLSNPGAAPSESLRLTLLALNGSVGGNLTDIDANTPGIQLTGSAASLSAAFDNATFTGNTRDVSSSLTLTLSDTAGNTVTQAYSFNVI